MFWTSLLLSVSGYAWYLIFLLPQQQIYPESLTGLGGLFLISIIPAVVAFALNRFLLLSKPSVIKMIIVNILFILLLVGLTAFSSGLIGSSLFVTPVQPAGVLPFVWQSLSWLCGTCFLLLSALVETEKRISVINVLALSFLLIVPAIFLLTFMELPSASLVGIMLTWFILMVLALALEETAPSDESVVRYDFILFHALVPVLAGLLLFFAAFSREAQVLFRGAKNLFFFILNLLVYLLGLLSPPPIPENGKGEFRPQGLQPESTPVEAALEFPPWVFFILLALFILLFALLLPGLLKWLKMRLGTHPVKIKRKVPFSPLKALGEISYYIFFLGYTLLKGCLLLCSRIKTLLQKLQHKLKRAYYRCLPARTPQAKIFRSYEKFLRWGRRTGWRRKAGETPQEYSCRLTESSGSLYFAREEIIALTCLFQEARYSNRNLSWRQGTESEILLHKIKEKRKTENKKKLCGSLLTAIKKIKKMTK